MENYRYDCAQPEFDVLARGISDLFPEGTHFIGQMTDDADNKDKNNGVAWLSIQWVAMRFGSKARRMTLDVRIASPAWTRYCALPPGSRAHGFAVVRAFLEAALGSLEEQYAQGEALPRQMTIELGDEFA